MPDHSLSRAEVTQLVINTIGGITATPNVTRSTRFVSDLGLSDTARQTTLFHAVRSALQAAGTDFPDRVAFTTSKTVGELADHIWNFLDSDVSIGTRAYVCRSCNPHRYAAPASGGVPECDLHGPMERA